MNKENIFYYDGKSARATNVRVLVFNASINLYDVINDDLITSYPIKGASASRTGDFVYIYFDGSGTTYLQLNKNDQTAALLVKEVTQVNDGWIKKLLRQKVIVL